MKTIFLLSYKNSKTKKYMSSEIECLHNIQQLQVCQILLNSKLEC